jgi:uncharacterized protein YbjT (DUF2867 family)
VSVHVAEPETWKSLIEEIRPETAISALGTTMRKAGSEAVFRTVDYEMVLAFALAARAAGAHRMVTVSSVGAAAASSNFYLRIKGEMERDLRSLGFHRLDVFRPGLLRGERGTDRRLAERIGILVSPVVDLFLQGPFARYASTPAAGLAEAVAGALLDDRPGAFVWENPHFFWLADELWPYL